MPSVQDRGHAGPCATYEKRLRRKPSATQLTSMPVAVTFFRLSRQPPETLPTATARKQFARDHRATPAARHLVAPSRIRRRKLPRYSDRNVRKVCCRGHGGVSFPPKILQPTSSA